MLETICQDDKKLAKESLDELTNTIYDQVKHHKNNPSKKEIKKMLRKRNRDDEDEQARIAQLIEEGKIKEAREVAANAGEG